MVVIFTPSRRFTIMERTSYTHWIGGWLGIGPDLDLVAM
jgi:hypothetical protein